MLDSDQYCTGLWTDFVIKQLMMRLINSGGGLSRDIKSQSLYNYSGFTAYTNVLSYIEQLSR